MGETRHYLRFNVFLYVRPLLAILWRARWEKLSQVAWLNIGDDTAVLDRIVVINDYKELGNVRYSSWRSNPYSHLWLSAPLCETRLSSCSRFVRGMNNEATQRPGND